MRVTTVVCLLMVLLLLRFCARVTAGDGKESWRVLLSGSEMNLRGIAADFARPPSGKSGTDGGAGQGNDNAIVIWASGTNGRILRSADSGKTWKQAHIADAESLDFRGVQSFGALTAYAMSIGNDGKSRIYKTTDGGETWRLQYSDQRAEFFLDGLLCRREKDCYAISDPVAGKFLLLHTEDGEHWRELPREQMPAALPKEGAFAASNSSLAFCGDQALIFGTGGPAARVFRSGDAGRSWEVVETPILKGSASAGIFSVRCAGDSAVAVGGDYVRTQEAGRVAAYSPDRGATWKLAEEGPSGFCSGVDVVNGKTWLAVGPEGEFVSTDRGVHWKPWGPGDPFRPAGALGLNAVLVVPGMVLGAGVKGVVELQGDWSP